jgi:hypothetical protein
MKEKLWGILVHLSMDMWVNKEYQENPLSHVFNEDMWNEIIDETAKSGMNAIILDVGNGIRFESHPEIAKEGAYSVDWMRAEVKKCREKGIALIPKLNFSTVHDFWLGDYAHMISSSVYYKLTRDLIEEVADIFDHPEYIHLGMDEEDNKHQKGRGYVVYRQGEQYMKDLRHLVDCVKGVGVTPWIWTCPLFDMTEDFVEEFKPDELVLSPWYYNAFRPEHWTPVESRAEYVAYYNEGMYKDMGIKFVEEDPYLVNFRNVTPGVIEKGYKLIPCASVFNRCDYNTVDLMEYFKKYAKDEQILGYISAPWCPLQPTERAKTFLEETFRFFREAKKEIYGE